MKKSSEFQAMLEENIVRFAVIFIFGVFVFDFTLFLANFK